MSHTLQMLFNVKVGKVPCVVYWVLVAVQNTRALEAGRVGW